MTAGLPDLKWGKRDERVSKKCGARQWLDSIDKTGKGYGDDERGNTCIFIKTRTNKIHKVILLENRTPHLFYGIIPNESR